MRQDKNCPLHLDPHRYFLYIQLDRHECLSACSGATYEERCCGWEAGSGDAIVC